MRSEAWALFPGAVAYVWHAGSKAGIVQDSLDRCDFETRVQIVWVKNNFAIGGEAAVLDGDGRTFDQIAAADASSGFG